MSCFFGRYTVAIVSDVFKSDGEFILDPKCSDRESTIVQVQFSFRNVVVKWMYNFTCNKVQLCVLFWLWRSFRYLCINIVELLKFGKSETHVGTTSSSIFLLADSLALICLISRWCASFARC